MDSMNTRSESPSATTALYPRKRRRTKLACEPCRSRKRKCDGSFPCETCIHFEYDCFYGSEKSPRKPFKSGTALQTKHERIHPISPASAHHRASRPNEQDTPNHHLTSPAPSKNADPQMESLEANSGAAFVRRLGLKIDPSNAPRLHLFAWNVGDRLANCPAGNRREVTSILTRTEMRNLALVYFEKVAYAYGFIDQRCFYRRLDQRWTPMIATNHETDAYDPVFCGVAALGLLFSQKFPPAFEADLVETARAMLEQHSLLMPPSVGTVTGWVLRVAYLRMTSLPHTTWLASCSLMHVIEAARIHLESASRTVFEASSPQYEDMDLDTRRRLWGMAQHLNIWASFDLGRTKVTLSGASTKPVAPHPDDCTSQLLGLIPLTELLDPNKTRTVEEMEADLDLVLSEDRERPPVIMAQINLMLCIFRRLRARKSNMLTLQADRILRLLVKGLGAARQMVVDSSPWHHVANVPFQAICLLLAIDSRASLALLDEAMDTLQLVANTWNSAVMREAYNTAYLLILLHQRRKEEDAKALRDVLSKPAMTVDPNIPHAPGGTAGYSSSASVIHQQQYGPGMAATESAEFLWLEDLIADMPILREFDLGQFLTGASEQDGLQATDAEQESESFIH